MKIVILGSVALSVPPPMQGGTERIAYWQAVGLSRLGHDITLIAAKGSKADPLYALVEIGGDTIHPALGIVESSRNMRKELVYMAEVSQWLIDNKDSYDLILNNMRGGESTLLPIVKFLNKKFVTVMHLPIFDELAHLFETYKTPVITISNVQKEGYPNINYAGTVYNATDLNELPFVETPQDYLVMMGSVAPHKNQKDGILAAKALGIKLFIAGKIGNQAYWDKEIAPLVDEISVIHKGEMGIVEKAALLGGAKALLFPILWPEPFGLVMIEAMACGTPVVAYKNGAVLEVVEDSKNGFVIDASAGVNGLVEAVNKIKTIDRAYCRTYVEENFTIEKMVDSLETALQKIVDR